MVNHAELDSTNIRRLATSNLVPRDHWGDVILYTSAWNGMFTDIVVVSFEPGQPVSIDVDQRLFPRVTAQLVVWHYATSTHMLVAGYDGVDLQNLGLSGDAQRFVKLVNGV